MSEDLSVRARDLRAKLTREAESHGYHLNPDPDMVLMLCEGLETNIERHGYMGCPCRLLEGDMDRDLDIICPCDYRDDDLSEYGACYCALYVSDEVLSGKKVCCSIPERRPPDEERLEVPGKGPGRGDSVPRVWRCKVCGYLAARGQPPDKCPICGAQKERFEEFSVRGPGPGVWRCKVCGYLAARGQPPGKCPICGAQKERLERFSF